MDNKVTQRSGEPKWACDICGKSCRSSQGLSLHKLRAHQVHPSHPPAEKSPYLESLSSEVVRLKAENKLLSAQLEQSQLKGRLAPSDSPKQSTPSMNEMLFADWIEARTEKLRTNNPTSSPQPNPLAEKVANLERQLVEQRDKAIVGRIDSLERKFGAVPSHSEKVEFTKVLGDIADRISDKLSRKIDPIVNWVFREERTPLEIPPTADRERMEMIAKLPKEMVSEK